jgi:ketosteroid isomerase-like protein
MTSTPAAVWLAYNEAENRRDHAAMGALIATDLSVTVNGRPAVASAEDDLRAMRTLVETYPDYRREVEEVIDVGNRAAARWRMLGTPVAEGVQPLEVPGCSIVTVEDGVITAAHLYYQGEALDAALEAAAAAAAG